MKKITSTLYAFGLIPGTNKFASQKGMSMGKVRHIADIRADDMVPEGQDHIQLQSGTNQYASQKGMSMGSVRHVADIRADDLAREGMDHVQLQSGLSSACRNAAACGWDAAVTLAVLRTLRA